MLGDLFAATSQLEALSIPGAEIFYLPHLRLDRDDSDILRQLINETPWRQETIVVWGKRHNQPRLIAWYGDPGSSYSYSGIGLDPLPWTPLLMDLKRHVETVARHAFNSVLLNYYRDKNDSMGFHSDDEPELGPRPVIASLSFGAVRALVFKSKSEQTRRPVKINLDSGSLLIMQGDTQRNWKHGIAKTDHVSGPRVNLTFRKILKVDGSKA